MEAQHRNACSWYPCAIWRRLSVRHLDVEIWRFVGRYHCTCLRKFMINRVSGGDAKQGLGSLRSCARLRNAIRASGSQGSCLNSYNMQAQERA